MDAETRLRSIRDGIAKIESTLTLSQSEVKILLKRRYLSLLRRGTRAFIDSYKIGFEKVFR